MSKYIIELDEDVKIVQSISVTPQGNAYTNTQWLANIEELNSDYINEHFGELQDDAYNKGYAQCRDDYSDALKHAKDTAYQKGLEEGKAQSERGCKGCLYEDEHLPCEYCANSFKSQWTAKDDKIEVGDEVEISQSDANGIWVVIKVDKSNGCESYCAINKDGDIYFEEEQDRVTKTGRHFDIASILEDMRHDS